MPLNKSRVVYELKKFLTNDDIRATLFDLLEDNDICIDINDDYEVYIKVTESDDCRITFSDNVLFYPYSKNLYHQFINEDFESIDIDTDYEDDDVFE